MKKGRRSNGDGFWGKSVSVEENLLRPTSRGDSPDGEQSEWLKAILAALRLPTCLLLVNNKSESSVDKQFLDDQLARIAVIQATIANHRPHTRFMARDMGFPPFTFSEVMTCRTGSLVDLAQGWLAHGMPTLLHFPVLRPSSDTERRGAILYGMGNMALFRKVEDILVRCFNPQRYPSPFGQDFPCQHEEGDQVQFFVQWLLFDEEVAQALGISTESPEFKAIMDVLNVNGPADAVGVHKEDFPWKISVDI